MFRKKLKDQLAASCQPFEWVELSYPHTSITYQTVCFFFVTFFFQGRGGAVLARSGIVYGDTDEVAGKTFLG